MKTFERFPVTKNGKFFGYADARQIQKSGGILKLYSETRARDMEAEKAVAVAQKADKIKSAKSAGADPNAVKKGA